jgi:hypothetical protein
VLRRTVHVRVRSLATNQVGLDGGKEGGREGGREVGGGVER